MKTSFRWCSSNTRLLPDKGHLYTVPGIRLVSKFYNDHREDIEAHKKAQAAYSAYEGKMPTLKELTDVCHHPEKLVISWISNLQCH